MTAFEWPTEGPEVDVWSLELTRFDGHPPFRSGWRTTGHGHYADKRVPGEAR